MTIDDYCFYVKEGLAKNSLFIKQYPTQYSQIVLFLKDFRVNIKNDGRCAKIAEFETFLRSNNIPIDGLKDFISKYHIEKELDENDMTQMCNENTDLVMIKRQYLDRIMPKKS